MKHDPALYLTDSQIAEAVGVDTETMRRAMVHFDRDPRFPRPDPLFGNRRFWPKLRAFLHERNGLTLVEVGNQPIAAPQGEEKPFYGTPEDRRRSRPPLARTR